MEEQKIEKRYKPLWRRIAKICLTGFVVFLLLFFTGIALLCTPKRLAPIAARMAETFFIADVRFDTLKVSFFQEFPYVNFTIKNGEVRSRVFESLTPQLQEALPLGCDSLLRFEELSVSLHLKKLLQSQIDIRRIRIRNACVHAYLSPSGIANWDIFIPDTTAVDDTNAFHLNLQRLIIRDGFRLTYRSDSDSLSASLQCNRLFIKGDIGAQIEEIKLETLSVSGMQINGQMEPQKIAFASFIDSLRLTGSKTERYTLFLQSRNTLSPYVEALPVGMSGELGFSPSRLDSLFFKDFSLSVADMPLLLNGSLVLADPQPRAQLDCRIDSLSLAGIASLLSSSLLPQLQTIRTDITAKIDASINYPAYTLNVATSGGYLDYPPENAHIHTFALDATYAHRPDRPELSGIHLRRCDVEASGISLHAKGYVQNPLGDPKVDLSLLGNIRLDTLSRILSLSNNVTARGAIAIDATAKFVWSNLLKGDLNNSTLRGRVETERLLLRLPKDSILIMARNGHLSFGANQNQRNSLIEQGRQILRLSFRADSTNIRYKQQFRLTMGNTRLSARSAASALDGDSTRIHPFNGSLETRYLSMQTADSTRLKLEGGICNFSLLPAPQNNAIPVVTARLQAKLVQMSDPENHCQLLSPQIALQATHFQSARSAQSGQRRGTPPDSLQTRSRQSRTSNRVVDDFTSEDVRFEMDDDSKRLFRRWQFEGTIQADGGALATPYFPLAVTLGSTDIEFSSEEFRLMQTQITAGRSIIECTGRVSNLRQVLLGRGVLGVSGFVRSDTLDVNELMLAANAGSQYASSGVAIAALEEASSLVIIPANVALNLKLFSGYTHYANEYFTDLSGSLTSQSRTLQINDLEASSSVGAFKMSALYATRSRNDITVGFDIDMKKVQVERLIALLPAIDTLAPMLRSFEGVADCQISATAAMDTEMNLLLPTLKAACRIQGQNMVLLDGETFTEISKMLYFKNKKRNLIDRIAVDLLIHDSQIEVFPFILEMDRYRTAVSGIHKFDLTFDYHISVLRSPIPFRLGVDATGTLDDPHYRLVRCRYRDTNIPSYVTLIDATRIHLLQAIKAFDPAAAFSTVERSVSQAARMREQEEIEEEETLL